MSVGHCSGRWPSLTGRMPARAGKARDPSAAGRLEPAAAGHSAAASTETSAGDRRSRRPCATAARLCREKVGPDRQVWEYAALVTSLDSEILTLGQLYRDRADCENTFDELKNQWGWGGFTTHDLKRCRLLARSVALIYNWWSLFVRLADPQHHREAITSRPLLLTRPGAANPPCRPGEVDGQQRARQATSGPPGLSAYRRLHGPTAAKCGAVGRARAVVSHPQ